MTDALRDFLTEWLAWAEADAPKHPRFNRKVGLCNNAPYAARSALDELLDRDFPENMHTPFGHERYFRDARTGTHHCNPERLAWVRKILEELNAQ